MWELVDKKVSSKTQQSCLYLLTVWISFDEVEEKKSAYFQIRIVLGIFPQAQICLSKQTSHLPKQKRLHTYAYVHLHTQVHKVYSFEIGWIERAVTCIFFFKDNIEWHILWHCTY